MISYSITSSSLGWILGAVDMYGSLVKVSIDSSSVDLFKELKTSFPTDPLHEDEGLFKSRFLDLSECIEDPKKKYPWSILLLGTGFQNTVWDYLRTIPSGQTMTYSEVARKIGKPRAVRAVANACAANNLAIVVPCHRVIRNNGQLSGYRWGVKVKKLLLERERNEQA